VCYRMPMPVEESELTARSSASARIIATAMVIGFCYWASSVIVTVLTAVLLAYFLDPLVS